MTALVAVSHGTADPLGQERIALLVRSVAEDVHLAHVDVQSPRVQDVLNSLPPGRPAVVVPVLLSSGYHVKVDLHEAAVAADRPVSVAPALGPDDRLVDVLVQRALESGFVRGHHQLVLGAAGSTDAGAIDDCRAVAERLAERLETPVNDAYLSAARPGIAVAVGRRCREGPGRPVMVLSYLLAPGYFQSLLIAEATAAGAERVTVPLLGESGPVPEELVQLVLTRSAQRGVVLR
ncbi:sirohydrochlorin chelatase [Citricoccus sp. GCM10030269]|uniref:sirohydrochlorin chelatase n=1 Tax=Citricoccus sp. GCM10030269 TaxID=3273388 RepID=UPI003615C07D